MLTYYPGHVCHLRVTIFEDTIDYHYACCEEHPEADHNVDAAISTSMTLHEVECVCKPLSHISMLAPNLPNCTYGMTRMLHYITSSAPGGLCEQLFTDRDISVSFGSALYSF